MYPVNVRGTFPVTPVSHGSCGALGRAPIFSTDIDSVMGSDRHSRMRRINGWPSKTCAVVRAHRRYAAYAPSRGSRSVRDPATQKTTTIEASPQTREGTASTRAFEVPQREATAIRAPVA